MGQLIAIVSFYCLGTALPGSALSGAGVRHSSKFVILRVLTWKHCWTNWFDASRRGKGDE
jgi:hypothetical protein